MKALAFLRRKPRLLSPIFPERWYKRELLLTQDAQWSAGPRLSVDNN